MQEDQQPEPNYWTTIPTHVLDDPRIDDSTAILFGRISSLTKSKGYCYASDKYLAELTRVSPREVRSRLLVLEKCGYIIRDTKKNGVLWDRKIFSNYNYERNECSVREEHTFRSKGSYVPNTNIRNTKIRKKEPLRPKKEKPKKEKPKKEVSADAGRCVDFFISKIRERDPTFKDPDRHKWGIQLDLLHSKDNHSWEDIQDLISDAQSDDFWCSNILSPTSLRKQFTRLKMRFSKNQKKDPRDLQKIVDKRMEEVRGRYRHLHSYQITFHHDFVEVTSKLEPSKPSQRWLIKSTDDDFLDKVSRALELAGHI